jgi:hypothetical protein
MIIVVGFNLLCGTALVGLAQVLWIRFATDPKCIGKIHLVSPCLTVDQTCLNIYVGTQRIEWNRSRDEIECIDLLTGQRTHLSRRSLWLAYRCLLDAFDNISKLQWD